MEVLLAGNTGYVTETFIEESFPECDVVVLGNEMLKSNRKKNILSRPFIKDEKELKEIFETYEFERIVYFSNYLTMHGRMTGELEQLRQILQLSDSPYCFLISEISVLKSFKASLAVLASALK